jgi:hypothetical protein
MNAWHHGSLKHPAGHTVAEPIEDQAGIVREPTAVARAPNPGILERLWEIPMVEGDEGLDACLDQLVHEPLVEVEARRAGRAGPGRLDPCPGDREPIGPDTQPAHEGDVLGHAPVVIAGDIAVGAVDDRPGPTNEAVPNGLAASVDAGAAFDLVGGGGHPPEELCRNRRSVVRRHLGLSP